MLFLCDFRACQACKPHTQEKHLKGKLPFKMPFFFTWCWAHQVRGLPLWEKHLKGKLPFIMFCVCVCSARHVRCRGCLCKKNISKRNFHFKFFSCVEPPILQKQNGSFPFKCCFCTGSPAAELQAGISLLGVEACGVLASWTWCYVQYHHPSRGHPFPHQECPLNSPTMEI